MAGPFLPPLFVRPGLSHCSIHRPQVSYADIEAHVLRPAIRILQKSSSQQCRSTTCASLSGYGDHENSPYAPSRSPFVIGLPAYSIVIHHNHSSIYAYSTTSPSRPCPPPTHIQCLQLPPRRSHPSRLRALGSVSCCHPPCVQIPYCNLLSHVVKPNTNAIGYTSE